MTKNVEQSRMLVTVNVKVYTQQTSLTYSYSVTTPHFSSLASQGQLKSNSLLSHLINPLLDHFIKIHLAMVLARLDWSKWGTSARYQRCNARCQSLKSINLSVTTTTLSHCIFQKYTVYTHTHSIIWLINTWSFHLNTFLVMVLSKVDWCEWGASVEYWGYNKGCTSLAYITLPITITTLSHCIFRQYTLHTHTSLGHLINLLPDYFI